MYWCTDLHLDDNRRWFKNRIVVLENLVFNLFVKIKVIYGSAFIDPNVIKTLGKFRQFISQHSPLRH